ncbi:MAG: FadR/GntR family transcriptional regulator [Devosia sp.]|jgi:DNA-binding FadR family transcriptional regulator|nr:FCD domain-containing protein [Alphaproteobacteria bacterium]MBU1562939.1 FCD domain-containing protein [Alphaproteobacteria bacterium]MBU2303081.1 FCD domain-containing protein [Alphaproteobacteria bacterium]MBU2368516.1 FCD domain-containing protein [Alphaproteobacteria bacterium]
MIEAGSLIRSLSGRPAARNFHTFVINEIGHAIVTGKFPVGSILASDAVMMETYGVSRTVLREALKTLEAKGLVEARPKVGTRVSPTSRWSFFDPQVLSWHFYAKPDRRFYESLFDVRRALEARATALAAQRRTAENIRVMKYWLHQMDSAAGDLENHGIAALEIHRTVAETSGNALLRSVTGIVELTLALALRQCASTDATSYLRSSYEALSRLVAAIGDADAEAAMAAVEQVIALDEASVFTALPQL